MTLSVPEVMQSFRPSYKGEHFYEVQMTFLSSWPVYRVPLEGIIKPYGFKKIFVTTLAYNFVPLST